MPPPRHLYRATPSRRRLGVFAGLLALTAACAASVSGADSPKPAEAGFDSVVQPYLNEHCARCHNEKKHKGELRLDALPRDFAAGNGAARWGDVIDRISTGEMPPEKEPRPKAEESARVVEWLAGKLKEGEAARMGKRERVTFHRLTRDEYANTLRDLLGVTVDVADPGGLPEDPNWRGFERVGSVLSISPAHIEKYLSAAEGALAEAMPEQPPSKVHTRWTAFELRGIRNANQLKEQGLADKVRLDVWPGSTFTGQPGSVHNIDVKTAGEYRFRVKLSGLKPEGGRAPHVAIYAADLDRMLFEQDVVAAEESPVTLEFRAHLPVGSHPLRMTNEAPGPSNLPRAGRNGSHPFFSIKQGREPWQTKLTDEQGKPILPFLIVDWIEFEGPILESWPTPARQQYLPDLSGAKEGKDGKEGHDAELAAAREALSRFAAKAFRRPATDAEVGRLVRIVEHEIQAGETFHAAVKTAMLAALCSKDFLYLVEGSPKDDVAAAKVNDWELASRLSYFLWATMPDEPLFQAARSGNLHEPAVLKAQLDRMLHDPRVARFSDAFARQWLQLRRVGMFPPDKKLYPTYDDYLQKSMIGEDVAFFAECLEKNLSLREFLQSDWTMLNARLAEHYGIPGVADDAFVRVSLRPEEHRGGLLTSAAVLSLTSDGTRHRPVHRGKWVLESIIGKPPPPPPANVKPIEPTPAAQKKATVRMKIAAHVSDPNCAACHRKIDPLGLAFDNYDAIGRWRTEEVVRDGAGDNPKVDASGELPDGREFDDADGLKRLLADDIDKFNAAFVEKLATFALRRTMTMDDRIGLADVAKQSKASGYRLESLVEALVMSELFQKR